MEFLDDIEFRLMEINMELPRLPRGMVDFFARWAWLFGAITAAVSFYLMMILFFSLSSIFAGWLSLGTEAIGSDIIASGALNLKTSSAGLATFYFFITSLFSLIALGITIVLRFKSVGPMKNKLYRGWQLALLAKLVDFSLGSISNLFAGEFLAIFKSLLIFLVTLYLLLQIRIRFTSQPIL